MSQNFSNSEEKLFFLRLGKILCHLEYIFLRSRKVSPRDGREVKTCFICREKVSFSAIVEKKDSCLTERSSCLTDFSSCLPSVRLGRQRREIRQQSEVSHFHRRGINFLPLESFLKDV